MFMNTFRETVIPNQNNGDQPDQYELLSAMRGGTGHAYTYITQDRGNFWARFNDSSVSNLNAIPDVDKANILTLIYVWKKLNI